MAGTLNKPARIKQTSTTTGTGTYTLIAAAGAYLQNFSASRGGFATGSKVAYVATDNASGFEIGYGTLTIGPPDTISRDRIVASSNANAPVNWASGTRDVFVWDPGSLAYVGVSADTTLDELDWGNVYELSGTTARTMTLPARANVPRGFFVGFVNASSAAMTIARASSDTIDGQTSIVLGPNETCFVYASAAGTWRTVGRAGLVPLTMATLSGASTADFTAKLDGTYDEYLFVIADLTFSTNNVALDARLSENAGVSWDSTAGHYSYWYNFIADAGTNNPTGSTSDALFILVQNTSSAAGKGLQGELRLFAPGGAALNKLLTWDITYRGNTSGGRSSGGGTFIPGDTNAVTGVRFLPSSGTISGRIALYGIRKPQ